MSETTPTASADDPALPPPHQTSQAGIDLIVTEEDSGEAYYTKHYVHFEWPHGASGPTVGIGYDCGYVTAEQVRKDWSGIVSEETIRALMRAAGLKGQAAAEFVREHYASVTITWDQAMAEFENRELPKWEAACRKALPNYDDLPPDCAGAIDSLAYNRGAGGFHAGGDRDREMRAIHDHMEAKRFDLIPAEFLSMRRLWPVGGDLWRRRTHEAALFTRGLNQHATAHAQTPQVATSTAPNVRVAQVALNKIHARGTPLKVDNDLGRKTRRAIISFQRAQGLTITGLLDRSTDQALRCAVGSS